MATRLPVILHVDADTFFLAVHEREDPSLRNSAVALWQYNDVVCASRKARALGVSKHMRPQQARALIEPAGGRMLHAYWREWPGPRIWYGPYNAAPRELFAALAAALREIAPHAIIERASIDEAFVDLSLDAAAVSVEPLDEQLFGAAEQMGLALHTALERSGISLPVSIGIAPNKLLAKLCSNRAKGSESGVCMLHNAAEIDDLLAETRACKLPGLGSKQAELEAVGLRSARDMQRLSALELQSALRLTPAAAAVAAQRCRGVDSRAVCEVAPRSCSVTSWTACSPLTSLAIREAPGRGPGHERPSQMDTPGAVADASATVHSASEGAAERRGERRKPSVMVAGWRFEPHGSRSKSNETRGRWIVLALALDLEERLCHHALLYREAPTRLVVGWQASKEPWGNWEHKSPEERAAGPCVCGLHAGTAQLGPHAVAFRRARARPIRHRCRFDCTSRDGLLRERPD